MMKLSKFELSMIFGVVVTYTQLMCGFTAHTFYGILVLILIVLEDDYE